MCNVKLFNMKGINNPKYKYNFFLQKKRVEQYLKESRHLNGTHCSPPEQNTSYAPRKVRVKGRVKRHMPS